MITLVTIITLASVSWDGISQALLRSVWVLSLVLAIVSTVFWCYEGITLLYIMPEEVSALERVRSEIVVWVRGCYFAAFSGDITTTKRSLPTAYEERGVLDAAVIRTVFKLAGLPSEDIHVAPPVVPSVAKVPPSALPPRVLAHARRTSNMANPGPQHDQDMLAINAIAGVLRSGSSDHRGGIVTDAVDGALNEIRTTTQRIGEMVERQMPANLTMPRSRAASTTAGESIAPSSTRTQSNAASLKSRHSTAQ